MDEDLNTQMVEFVQSITKAMGLELEITVEAITDGTRVVIAGDGCDAAVPQIVACKASLQLAVTVAAERLPCGVWCSRGSRSSIVYRGIQRQDISRRQ